MQLIELSYMDEEDGTRSSNLDDALRKGSQFDVPTLLPGGAGAARLSSVGMQDAHALGIRLRTRYYSSLDCGKDSRGIVVR